MRLYTPREITNLKTVRVFRNRSWAGLLGVTVIMALLGAYIAIPKEGPTNAALYLFPGMAAVLFLILFLARLRTCVRPANWLLRQTEDGLYIHLRSYMNFHFGDDEETVLFIPNEEIAGLRKTKESRVFPGRRNTVRDHFSYIDILLTRDDLDPARSALRKERRREAPRGPFRRKKHHDYPVRIPEPCCVRLLWDWIRPAEDKAIAILSERYPILPDHGFKNKPWDEMPADEKEALIAQLWETGALEDATHLTATHHNMGRTAAKNHLEEQLNESPPA